jgi:hypothetical protein
VVHPAIGMKKKNSKNHSRKEGGKVFGRKDSG